MLDTPANEAAGKLSPNGRWLAYQSNESGRAEVYVQAFLDRGTGRWQVSQEGGRGPIWSRDGTELFYIAGDNRMMAVPVQSGNGVLGRRTPRALLDGPRRRNTAAGYGNLFDVGPDGRFLLPVRDEGRQAPTPLTVVLNWISLIRR